MGDEDGEMRDGGSRTSSSFPTAAGKKRDTGVVSRTVPTWDIAFQNEEHEATWLVATGGANDGSERDRRTRNDGRR